MRRAAFTVLIFSRDTIFIMNPQKIFFLSLFLIAFGFLGYIFSPFLGVILLAIVTGIAVEPVSVRIKNTLKVSSASASLATVFLVLVVIGLTVGLIGTQLTNQAQNVYQNIVSGNQYEIDDVSDYLNNLIRPVYANVSIDLRVYINPVVSFVAQNVGGIVSGTASIIFKFLLWLVTLYFVLKDGRSIKTILARISPLKDIHDNKLFSHIASAARSIVKGVFFVALIQGVFVGLGLWFVGIQDALFWGLIAALAAPIPLLGTSVVMVPSVSYLILSSQFVPAIVLTAWGITVVGLVDNVLTPYFYSKGTEIHPLILLFSILGGIALFGAIGFIIGPLIATIALTLTSLYQEIVLEERTT